MQNDRQTQLLDDNRRRIPRIKLIPSSNLESLSKHYKTPDSLVYCQHNYVSITPHYSLIDEEFITNLNTFHTQIKYHSGAGIKRLIFDWNNADMSFNQPNGKCSIFLNNLFGYKYQPAFSNLSDLALILEAKPEAVDDLIPIIQAVGKNLGSLRAFTFEFSPFAMTNPAFKKLGSTISYHLPDLVYLHLKLIGSDVIDDEGLEYFLTQIHRRLHNLKYLGLELDLFPEVTDKCVEMFGHLINSEKSQLEGFKLGIWNCWKVGYDTIIKFLRNIKHPLPHLRECALKFSNTTDQGLEALGSYLSDYFTHLKILSLDFSDCEGITSSGLSLFGSKITGHLDELEHLALNFSISESRVDDDFRVIGYGILLGLPSLKILDLDFNTCPEISDDGLEILGFVILPKLANLTRFRLSLSKVGGYKGITDKGFKLLAATIAARLKNLHELILELDNCQEITDDAFQEAFPRLLLEIKTLKDLKLYLNDCPRISDNGLEAVAARIAGKSSSIEELTLRISGCNSTQKFQENIKKILS